MPQAKIVVFILQLLIIKAKPVKELDEYNDEVEKKKHFSFELDGSLVGREYNNDHDFAYAWYREEMKA